MGAMMPLSEGWRDHYERMLRSRARLAEAAGPSSIGSDEARDRLYHFFQDAFHLRDWLYNSDDPVVAAKAAGLKHQQNTYIKTTPVLALCADVCNGTKHFTLSRAETGDTSTTISSQSVAITLPAFEVRVEFPGPAERKRARREAEARQAQATATHEWIITSDGQPYDAVQLADDVIAAWNSWLNAKSLL
ncbi:hypothetical protein ACQP2T_13580 [Nonomuraea sp. CA-143628]|uniref:hypothetical protein n=1 Tax=Nonomuraea sp. CA-143628 TaxID=3239997 RepID=UPI003D8D6D24